VFRRTQQIVAKLFGRGSSERTTVCMISRPLVVRAPVWFSRLPVDMLVSEPERLNIHAVQDRRESIAGRRDWTAARFVCAGSFDAIWRVRRGEQH
jgi:hypothetical protein